MTPRARPKSSPTRQAERLQFDRLPEDVLILVFCQCRIDELFALRLTNSNIRNIISDCIATIAPSTARSTYPINDHLLTPPEDPAGYTIDWLKGLVPQHLAAILVDKHRFTHEWMEERYGIPAEDPYGDDLRARIASGWRVLRRLSQISQEVYGLPAKTVLKSRTDIAWKVVHPSRFESEVVNQREDIIFKRRMEYIKNLPGKLAEDYKMMFMLLSSAFRSPISNYGEAYTPWVFDWSCGIDGQRLLRRGQSWVTWFVLHEGPDLFRDQWWNLPHDLEETKNHIRDRLINAWFGTTKISPEDYMRHFLPKEWNDVNEKLHTMQRDYASKIHKALDDKATPGFINASPIRCFSQYAECRQLRVETGVPPIRETLSHVPFHIDFRCPDELFQKHCTVTRERSLAAMASPFSARE